MVRQDIVVGWGEREGPYRTWCMSCAAQPWPYEALYTSPRTESGTGCGWTPALQRQPSFPPGDSAEARSPAAAALFGHLFAVPWDALGVRWLPLVRQMVK